MTNSLPQPLQNDIFNITQITAVPSILNIICQTTGMRFSAVARVTDTQWITCLTKDEINFGLKTGDELVLETTICNEIRQHAKPVIIEEVRKSTEFCNHHTPAQYGFQSYISFPIFRKNGDFFGTLCAIDPEPAKLDTKEVRDMFELYTQLISFHLDAIEEVNELTQNLQEQKQIGKLRDTFIAILGHDLRSPIGNTSMCADMLLDMELPATANRLASLVKSTSQRMQGLIDNLLDFAKGHLGEGIILELSPDKQALTEILLQVSHEFKMGNGDREIVTEIDLRDDFECDINRVSQVYSNLLANAINHGASDKPINTKVIAENGIFSLSVSNSGDKIPKEKIANLFKPFFSTNAASNRSGLGLGLHISSEIAKAHGGEMKVISNGERTTFAFEMPI